MMIFTSMMKNKMEYIKLAMMVDFFFFLFIT